MLYTCYPHLQVSPDVVVEGTDCDVSNPARVARLASYAKSKLGRIDVWINNAGYSGSFQVSLLMSVAAEVP